MLINRPIRSWPAAADGLHRMDQTGYYAVHTLMYNTGGTVSDYS